MILLTTTANQNSHMNETLCALQRDPKWRMTTRFVRDQSLFPPFECFIPFLRNENALVLFLSCDRAYSTKVSAVWQSFLKLYCFLKLYFVINIHCEIVSFYKIYIITIETIFFHIRVFLKLRIYFLFYLNLILILILIFFATWRLQSLN